MRSLLIRAFPARPTTITTLLPSRATLPSIVRLSSTTSTPSPATTTAQEDPSTTTTTSTTTTITRNPPSTPTPAPSHTRPYLINLSASNNYPVYPRTKAAGQSKFTVIKHVEGDKRAFVQDLCEETGLSRDHVVLQPVTGHVQVKGLHVDKLKKWLVDSFGDPHKAKVPVDAIAP
ncbi:hypothetical protein SODALDRAFT_323887 [Sodiomyces alkalinus F11]|uniref:Large ribosomal subunit protein mL49 n=1 Tax=Sodiomyces alkalinus (strain CBS 110278 / VKM F-3762 / F11) TaxID=1314773 RepID=A0A3N2PVA3_SODAK|nr:hypothetical protein SODALDRAFT_323887 [Sodiomyces alkalinus F11]ROT38404.1 hypothetical protein SODALDRAFT_323887 [Sodiomyces alkalinus F11]